MNKLRIWITTGAMIFTYAAPTAAVTEADKCQAAKLKIAGKYGFCRLKAEAKGVKKGDPPDFAKCDEKYSTKWQQAEAKAGPGVCPSAGDETPIQAFLTQHTDDVVVGLAGGFLPDCPGDLAFCNFILTSCSAAIATCNTDLTACDVSLASCSTNLATVSAGSAAPADVLSGATFSSGAGLGQTGTMPDNGAVLITPGASPQSIPVGFHNGSGTVAGDADLVAGNIKSGVDIFGVTGTVQPPPLRTGQTTSYGAGDDGDLQKGASRSFTDNGDGTITDNTTRLMWEKKSDDGSIHDWDNVYTWGGGPTSMDGSMVTTFLAALNGGGGFAGYTDWRIPNLNELQSLANYQNANPAVSSAFNTDCAATCTVTTCSCTVPNVHWSSTTFRNDHFFAWTVDFFVGNLITLFKGTGVSVRAVRGGS